LGEVDRPPAGGAYAIRASTSPTPMLWSLALAFAACAAAQVAPFAPLHVSALGDEAPLRLAAKDATRYLRLLRCGHGPSAAACAVLAPALPPPGTPALLISTLGTLSMAQRAALAEGDVRRLEGDAHLIAPLGGGVTLCTGATPRAALYAVYALLEALGARFYLTGDVLPPPNASLALPATPLLFVPLFAERGLQPFHDFPMGCVHFASDLPFSRPFAKPLTPWLHTLPHRAGGAGPTGGRWSFSA
jgi:hypothetical protein